jgi:hypothetical protein
VDLALVVHGLELTDSPIEMLQEVWRVMAPQGRLILVVPNRRGLQMPPTKRGFVLSGASAIERVCDWITPRFSGVIIVEAVKQVYAFSSGKRVRRLMPRFKPALLPSPVRFDGGK